MKTVKMRPGRLFVMAAAGLLWSASAFAGAADSQIDMEIDDQPGYTPSAEEENLAGPFERQVVFFRTTEEPGTIVVSVSRNMADADTIAADPTLYRPEFFRVPLP